MEHILAYESGKGKTKSDRPLLLVAEDDRQMLGLYRTLFETSGYPCRFASTGRDALMEFMSRKPDIMLLDLGLPDPDGQEIIKKVRSFSTVPILVVSARDEDDQKVEALDAGADDYLCKPFSVDELLARIRVLERRLNRASESSCCSVYENGPLRIDYEARCALMDGKPLHLTPIEYRLLVLFSKNTGRVLTRHYIVREVWGTGFEEDSSSLRVYMTMLRKKLNHRLIETEFGVGYRMRREAEEDL